MFEADTDDFRRRILFPSEFEADYEERVLQEARAIVQRRFSGMDVLALPRTAREYLAIRLASYSEEVFACLFMTTRHQVIAFEILFRGTLTGCSVHERVVAKRALANNAAAVILVHNHPSGIAEPSEADVAITGKVREALNLMEVRLIDHFVIGGNAAVSMAERGLI
ncbi:JAB domain-containing protein [Tahibacter soli]|uniref:JAB domain-containing protein n=1 Tax=Tahibacter soli TaxID=2983605 RepID=A0A9X3YRT1_9GAMM|nr:JAB domain-containing protein [Tahibacter soli]MDC8015848.1 JAB domain-containing protein [Tahibacter soli]